MHSENRCLPAVCLEVALRLAQAIGLTAHAEHKMEQNDSRAVNHIGCDVLPHSLLIRIHNAQTARRQIGLLLE